MIIDAHTHICPPDIRQNREKFVSDSEPAFSSIYKDPKARLAGAAELVQTLDEEGVDKAVAFGFPWGNEDTARLHNDYIIESQERFPDRIIGLGCFDPRMPWAEKEAVRCLDRGLKGLGELALYDAGFDQEAIDCLGRLAGLCRERDVPMLVHVNEPVGHQYPGKVPLTLKMIYDLIKACAGAKLVLAHWGGGVFFYNLLKREAPEVLKNVYYDTAASPFLYRPDIYRLAAEIVGEDKVLFGSDYPLLKPARYFKEIDSAGLPAETAAQIKGDAAARLFGVK